MARPAKPVLVNSMHLDHEQKTKRLKTENELKGGDDQITPPSYLSAKQKKIFTQVVKELTESGILANLDVTVLSVYAIAVDRLFEIEKRINKDFDLILDQSLMRSKEKYTKDIFKCTQELPISPQSRAKFGIMALEKEKKQKDPLLKVLEGGKHG